MVVAAMADGIGDLVFASDEWVEAARDALNVAVARHAEALSDLEAFTICEVGHNPPAYLHCGSSLSWHAKFRYASVEVNAGELPAEECDYKIEGDHSIISNVARIQYHNRDPKLVAMAQTRLTKLSRWEMHGQMPEHPGLGTILRSLHDTLAVRTMPRFVFMTPEWGRSSEPGATTSSPAGRGWRRRRLTGSARRAGLGSTAVETLTRARPR